jgi:CheY-like chemotaxis protein
MAKKIMVIDDEPDIRKYLMAALEDCDYETCTADEGESVLDAIAQERPDLVVLDIMMPRRSGVSIYLELRTSLAYKDIPVILISGISPVKDFMKEGLDKLIEENAISPPEAFIEKPVKLPEFLETVEKSLE